MPHEPQSAPSRRRATACATGLLLGLVVASPRIGSQPALVGPQRVEVWIELTVPPMAPADDAAARAVTLQAIDAQQAVLVAALQPLGGVVRARVRLVRNAVLVDLPASAVGAARRLPGVLTVRVVQHRMRVDDAGP